MSEPETVTRLIIMRNARTTVLNCRPSMYLLAMLVTTCLVEIITFPVCLAQTRFRDDLQRYEVTLPSSAWRQESRPNVSFIHTNFVYGSSSEVRLRIRLRLLSHEDTAKTAASRDRMLRRDLPGLVNSGISPFVGKLSGFKVEYEYVRAGRLVSVQTYYLEANNREMWVLRFTGAPDMIEQTKDETESIARSFHVL